MTDDRRLARGARLRAMAWSGKRALGAGATCWTAPSWRMDEGPAEGGPRSGGPTASSVRLDPLMLAGWSGCCGASGVSRGLGHFPGLQVQDGALRCRSFQTCGLQRARWTAAQRRGGGTAAFRWNDPMRACPRRAKRPPLLRLYQERCGSERAPEIRAATLCSR